MRGRVSPKNDIFPTQPDPYRFQKFDFTFFYSSQYAVCLKSLVEIPFSGLEEFTILKSLKYF